MALGTVGRREFPIYIEFHAGHFNHSLNILEAVPS
jgi:hypothetical protein